MFLVDSIRIIVKKMSLSVIVNCKMSVMYTNNLRLVLIIRVLNFTRVMYMTKFI